MNAAGTQQHWGIVGAGCIGHLLAARLQRCADVSVSLLGRHAARHKIKLSDGQVLTCQTQVRPFTQPCDVLVIATKCMAFETALRTSVHQLAEHGTLLTIQNGMGFKQHIETWCPDTRAACLLLTSGVTRKPGGQFVESNNGPCTLGALGAHTLDPQLETTLLASGLACHTTQKIEQARWLKLAINCAINPLSLIHNCRNGELLTSELALEHMLAICQEITALMGALDISIPVQSVFQCATDVANATAENYSSMWQDLAAGRETELDYLTGYILNRASELNLTCPVNQAIYTQVRTITCRQQRLTH